MTLARQPDTVVHIGSAEDGLPLMLAVERSLDLHKHLDAMASEIRAAHRAVPDALLSHFRQSLDQYVNETWSSERLVDVRFTDGETRRLYVSSRNLSSLFQCSLAGTLMAGNHSMTPRLRERAWARGEHNYSSVVRATVIRATEPAESSQGQAVLQSEGGRNRFLGVDPATGALSSVGRGFDGEWVRWREFLLEDLRASFPAMQFAVNDDRVPADDPDRLGSALYDVALAQAPGDGYVVARIEAVIPRQDLGHLLANIAASCIAPMHREGRVHGDVKPNNILLASSGPVAIDAFDVDTGDLAPGWTPDWSAPEQTLGQAVSPASDVYALGRMIVGVLGGCLVGEVRKFKTRPLPEGRDEFDIFYNPGLYVDGGDLMSSRALQAWQSFVLECLRFEPAERPADAAQFQASLRELLEDHPLQGRIRYTIPGELRVATLSDGSHAVARVIRDRAARIDAEDASWDASRSLGPIA